MSAKVPDVGAKGGAVELIEFPLNYVNAFSGFLIGFDFEFGILEFFGVAGEVEGEEFFEVSKFSSEFAFVERAFVAAFFVLDDEDGAVFGEDSDDVEPVVEVGVFTAIVHH